MIDTEFEELLNKDFDKDDNRHFSIVGSKFIRPYSSYNVSLNAHDNLNAINMKVGLRGNNNYEISKEVTMEPNTTQLITFDNEELPNEYYNLFAELLSTEKEKESLTLHTEIKRYSKLFSVFIQSDKAVYKPNDLIRFRVLLLNASLLPATSEIKGPVNIYVLDSQENRIKQWLNVNFHNGVYQTELQLSDLPCLGQWKIIADAMGEIITKQIEIAEYVLPKFNVTIDVSKHFTHKNDKIFGFIRSNYTYGKPVKGELKVSISRTNEYDCITNKIDKSLAINGKTYIEFDVKNELNICDRDDVNLYLEAVVVEELTGLQQIGSAKICLHKNEFNIRILKDICNYKPGVPFEILIQLMQHDDRPINLTNNKIIIMYGCRCYVDELLHSSEYTLDSEGKVLLTFNIPYDNIRIKAKYLNEEYTIGHYHKGFDKAAEFLEVISKTDNPKVGDEVTMQIKCNEIMKYLVYQIFVRGNIFKTETVNVDNKTEYDLKFRSTVEMIPKAQIIVYLRKGGDIISSKLEITFQNEFLNYIELQPSVSEATPGQNIDIIIKSNPNSFIGLLGVDQSVLLLKDGNDLCKTEILEELNNYSNAKYYKDTSYWQRNFDKVGAVILSNGIRINEEMCIMRKMCARSRMLRSAERCNVAPKIRKEFPETWIWDLLQFNNTDGQQILHKTVPDTITSWIITGFSIDPITGFSLTKSPTNLNVFQPFFVSLNLPYSIKCGETVAISVSVFNYMEKNVCAEVILHNNDEEFEFMENSSDYSEPPKNNLNRKKLLDIESNCGAVILFTIKPKRVGSIKIKVTATTPLAGDGMEKILPVEPEGTPQYYTKSTFIDLRDTNTMDDNFVIDIPENAVPDSTRIIISVVGDILGATIKNLDSLIRMPYGCGEQNMINFVPNIVILNYLKFVNQLTEAIETKAKKYMESGYQRELTYKHNDGSFSVFGQSDKSGSTWLTAFVARAFRQATVHIHIDEKIIDDALNWLAKNQSENGSFPEVGFVYDSHLQGGANSAIGLTAYTLISFLENKKSKINHQNAIDKAINYIIQNIDGLNDTYTLAVAAYALQLANHNAKEKILESLDKKANFKDNKKWWNKSDVTDTSKNACSKEEPNSVNVEMTAYALLAYLEAGKFTEAIPIMKWLIGQRNDKGGFQSTQDTVVGLQALAKFAEKISSTDNNIEIITKYNDIENKMIVNMENLIILQSHQVPSSIRSITINAKGKGFAVFQLAYQYNLNNSTNEPRFILEPIINNEKSNSEYLCLSISASYIPIGNDIISNMAVMEIYLPSGFLADMNNLTAIKLLENVKKVETKNGDTIIVIYFDSLGATKLNPIVNAIRSQKVDNLKPSPIIIYDYYDNSRRALEFYNFQSINCDA